MYNTIYETSHQSRFDAQYWMLGAGVLGQPRGIVQGRRREQIHVDIWQNQYNIVKLKNKIKKKESCGSYAQWNITQPLKRIHLNQF